METKVYKVDGESISEELLKEVGNTIKGGGLVAFPTETVYGLGANALERLASRKIYAAKGRPTDNPLIIHIARLQDLPYIVDEIPDKAKILAEVFWPGPLTMVMKKSEKVPDEITGGIDTVAVRMPKHPIALKIIEEGGGYIAAPSANTSGRPSPTLASHVISDLNGKIDIIIDGGSVQIGLESTIVDLTGEIPIILRPGYIRPEMLEQVIGPVKMDKALMEMGSAVIPRAPGMKYKHYAPAGDLIIIEGVRSKVIEYINKMVRMKEQAGNTVGVIATDESIVWYNCNHVKSIGSRSHEETIAHQLYATLREFDEQKIDFIFTESFHTPKMGQTIMNRLLKAAGHQVVYV